MRKYKQSGAITKRDVDLAHKAYLDLLKRLKKADKQTKKSTLVFKEAK